MSRNKTMRKRFENKSSVQRKLGPLFERDLGIDFKELVLKSRPLFEKADTPTTLALWLMLQYGEYEQYLKYEVKPTNYVCPIAFRRDWQCAKVFSKSEIFPRVRSTRHEAVKEFIKCEAECRRLNRRVFENGFRSLFSGDEWAIIHSTTRKISRILGDAPELSDLSCHFGPGLNVGLTYKKTSPIDKLSSRRTVTKECQRLIRKSGIRHPLWDALQAGDSSYPPSPVCILDEVVSGSRLTFVPKNAKTDRPICIEPLLNGFYQTGVGTWIRSRLKKAGCDLKSQTRNQHLAKVGSERNDLATVDLSSASDTIATSVVFELLPPAWFELLYALRSPSYEYEGQAYTFEKFSSMGNAYTFELESLIFLALTRSVAEAQNADTADINVYGDDIICPSKCCETLYSLLSKLGFRVSREKSFTTGPFRESCGKDYFLGRNVRPLYLKSKVTPKSLFVWLNGIRRLAGPNLEDSVLRAWYFSLRRLLPKPFMSLRGPDGYGDGHLIMPNPNRGKKHDGGWEGHWFYTVQAVLSYTPCPISAVPSLASYAVERPGVSDSLKQQESDSRESATFARGAGGYRVRKSFQRWNDPYALK